MSSYSYKGHECTESEYRAMAELKPLAGEDMCECGHKRALHINLHLSYTDHAGCCSATRCRCENFESADASA